MMGWTHPLVNADEIRQSIQESLDRLSLRPSHRGWKWWMATEAVLRGLGNLGMSKGLHVRSQYHGGEWLWDLCWMELGSDGWVKRLVLACESELSGRHNVKEDFQKILFSVADIRLLVCWDHKTDDGDRSFFKELEQYMKLHPGNYLVITVRHVGRNWKVEKEIECSV